MEATVPDRNPAFPIQVVCQISHDQQEWGEGRRVVDQHAGGKPTNSLTALLLTLDKPVIIGRNPTQW